MELPPHTEKIPDRSRPARLQFKLPLVFVLVTIVALVVAPIASCHRRRQQSNEALAEIQAFCLSKGGNFGRMMVDGEVDIGLAGASLTRLEAERLHQLMNRIVPEHLDYNGMVMLDVRGAQIEGGLLNLIHPKISELNLASTNTDDLQLARIAEKAPKLQYINLENTLVTDKSIDVLLKLPLYRVRLVRTRMSSEGRYRLKAEFIDVD